MVGEVVNSSAILGKQQGAALSVSGEMVISGDYAPEFFPWFVMTILRLKGRGGWKRNKMNEGGGWYEKKGRGSRRGRSEGLTYQACHLAEQL